MEHVQKGCCLAGITQFLDSMYGLNNVSIDEKVTERKIEKKTDSPTNETETGLQILSDHNQHHSLSQKYFPLEKSGFWEG